ncbi:MAG TPA: phosphoenolpyruvate carboxykinase (ATP) [Thermomicrobiaceae bacterium]|nr:phosphoenolpyruvate carboxykinase (ATP) [Thermomicrobiaceae bacterium]
METITTLESSDGLEAQGINNPGAIYWSPPAAMLYEFAMRNGEGAIAASGPLIVSTGKYTGRTPKDKFIVQEPGSNDAIWWDNNQRFAPEKFDALHRRVSDYLEGRDVYVQDCHSGADPDYRLKVRVITELAWHSLFVRNLFIRLNAGERFSGAPDFTVIDAAGFKAVPERDGTRGEAFIILNFAKRIILIGGTEYAGEMKKSIFSVMHYLLPPQGVVSMHCSANAGPSEDTALFFGLSGTGKTTLSTNPSRQLIGDDEHGWSDHGIFNFEGGSYAKVVRLSSDSEPEIYQASHRFGTILENVVYNPVTRELDLNDDSLTENTRSAYPISYIPGASLTGMGGHPRNVFFLSADAFGVLPPISRLTPDQARYYFLSGYTAKVAGTEVGLTEPEATFSTCFGEPFLPLPPETYSKLLGEKIVKHKTNVWLVNTGWIGGTASESERVPIAFTRAMLRAAMDGTLEGTPTHQDPIFGLNIPDRCPNVPQHLLNPWEAWKNPEAYSRMAQRLAQMFKANFEQFAANVPASVRESGPKSS